MGAQPLVPPAPLEAAPGGIELNGINAIEEIEHKGRPRDLFWPWFAANVSVLGIAYGSFLLDFGISFAQATVVGQNAVTPYCGSRDAIAAIAPPSSESTPDTPWT